MLMNSSGPSCQYIPSKRTHHVPSSTDFHELTNTFRQFNDHFKKTNQILTEIKDFILKICEKQNSRPVDDNSGVHKLERVRRMLFYFSYSTNYDKSLSER